MGSNVRFAVIGTNWITAALIEAGRTVPGFEAVAVMSRSQESGATFAQRHGIARVHTSIEALTGDDGVDAVYVASPNSLHARQSLAALRAGKHVLCEKPLAASAGDAREMRDVADQNGVLLMEAYVAPFQPNVMAIASALPRLGPLRRAVLVKDQYSSRYDALKSGRLTNAFDPRFAAGSLMDIGIYPVALSHHLFGAPLAVHASGTLLDSGVDGMGTVLLRYDGFEVACLHAKIAPGPGSWIAGEQGYVAFDDCSVPTEATLILRDGQRESLAPGQSEHHMRYEVAHFIDTIRSGARSSAAWPVDRSIDVLTVLDEVRRQVGVEFPTASG